MPTDLMDGDRAGGGERLRLLRHAMLAAAVIDDVDLVPVRRGFEAPAAGLLTWADIAGALGGWERVPAHPVTLARVATLLAALAALRQGGPAGLAACVTAHVEPAGSALHPGAAWVIERVGNGPCEAGWGLVGAPGTEHSRPLPSAPSIATAVRSALAGGHLDWASRRAEVDRLGRLQAQRLARDLLVGRAGVLRPVGRSDVPTLLLSPMLRGWLACRDGVGMAAVAVPTRVRGWIDLRRVDPDFAGAAWAATDPVDRGFPRPLLVTKDEVVLARRVRHVLGAAPVDNASVDGSPVDATRRDVGRG